MFYPKKVERWCECCGVAIGMQYRFRKYCDGCAKQRKLESARMIRAMHKEKCPDDVHTYRRMTDEERRYIIENYGREWLHVMAEHLHMDYQSLCNRIYQMKRRGEIEMDRRSRVS